MAANPMSTPRRTLLADRPRRLCALLALAVTLLFGGLGGGWVMNALVADAARASRQDAQVFGESVARTIATQFDRALRYGIAVEEVRGTDAYLARMLQGTPGLTRIALTGAQAQVIHRVGLPPQPDEIRAAMPIVFQGRTLGGVEVGVSPRTLASGHTAWGWIYLAGVLGVALLAAWWAGSGPGADLERRRGRVHQGLAAPLAEDLPSRAARLPHAGGGVRPLAGSDPLDAALRALDAGESRLREKQAAFEALAQELLAVDFDDRQAPEIERLRRQVRHSLTRWVA